MWTRRLTVEEAMFVQIVANGLVIGALIALLSTAFTIQFCGSRFFVFTFGSTFACGAYALLWLAQHVQFSAATALALLIASGLGGLLEYSVYGPLRRRSQGSLQLMLVSIGIYTVIQNLISLGFGDATRSFRTWPTSEGYAILGARVTTIETLDVLVALSLVSLATLASARLSLGKQLRALVDDDFAARVVGIEADSIAIIAASVGGALSGAAGILFSLDTDLVPAMGFQALLYAIVGCIMGGSTSVGGSALAGVLLGLILNIGVWKLPTQWQDAILFVVLVGVLIVRPRGLLRRRLCESSN